MSKFKFDTERKTIWDLSQGKIYNICRENDYYIVIAEPDHGIGLYDKKKDDIIITPVYDWIDEPYLGIPGDRNKPFIISKNDKHGIALPDGTIAINTVIDSHKYVVYPHTYGEGFVGASQNKANMNVGDPICFLNKNGEQCTGFNYTSVRQPFKDGKAIVTIKNYIIELDKDFTILDSYDSFFMVSMMKNIIFRFLSFPPYKCFRTFAVWKHFSIYPYPKIGNRYLIANSNISSHSSRMICQWKKFSPSVCSNGQT